jgi:hypothetical protein
LIHVALFNFPAFVPFTGLDISVFIMMLPSPMLFPIIPLSYILPSIRPHERSVPVLLIIDVIANIVPPVRPVNTTLTSHFVVLPTPYVNAPVFPGICPVPFDIVVVELT